MSAAAGLYRRAPVAMQHAAVTARGMYLRTIRYTRHTWETFQFLMESQYWSRDELDRYQFERLRLLVGHACRHSPYYRDRYSELGLDAGSIRSLADLAKLPILAKEDLRSNNERFFSNALSRRLMWQSRTSGTTGTPLTAFHTHRSMQERVAFMERLSHWYLDRRFRSRASFTGKLVVDPESQRPPFHRSNAALRQQLYSSHHLRSGNLDRYVEELGDFSPDQIDGIASPIYVIADHLLRTGRAGSVSPAVVIPTSETLTPYIRERMEAGFRAPVADQYGSQEGAPLAYECPEGGLHICPESGIFEILRPDGSPAEPEEHGRLVVTSFLSEGTPLIRYDIGDTAAWSARELCPCGRTMQLLRGIEGRVDDMFFTTERGIVPRVDSAFKTLPPSIVLTQVAQVGVDRFEVRLVPDPSRFEPSHAESLVSELHEYLGGSVRITVKLLTELPSSASGKLPAMVNECTDPEVRHPIASRWNKALPGR